MTLSRRRFLSITAACALFPATAKAYSWSGLGFGAQVSITLHAPRDVAEQAFSKMRLLIDEMESLFSLYRPGSSLSQLNAQGRLLQPDPRFLALVKEADVAHQVTQGLFDPTVQSIWKAKVQQKPVINHKGWAHVGFEEGMITLAPGQSLTFNGIAQGFATDAVVAALQEAGLSDILVNLGEYRALGGPWRLGLQDPVFGHMGSLTLGNDAIATSSPGATMLGAEGHILHPDAQAHWSTVSVQAKSATLADSLSTALVLAPLPQIREIMAQDPIKEQVSRIVLVNPAGDLITI